MNKYQLLSKNVPKSYFRAYDIRGIVEPNGLDINLAFALGQALGSEILESNQCEIIVGRDGRLSSPELSVALIDGVLSTGCNVINVGVVPTPLVYYATHHLSSNSGIMITGSHNPKDYNGFKIVLNGKSVSTDGIQAIYERIIEQRFLQGSGILTKNDIKANYINYVSQHVHINKPMKLVIDCGNGVASCLAPKLLSTLGCEVNELYCNIDGHFPNHFPDPSDPKNLQPLIEKVTSDRADLGIAFDGDGDRLGVVTNKGEIIWPDRIMMLFAKDLLKRLPGANILFDVKCTNHLPQVIKSAGGHPVMYKTGHSLIKNKMLEISAALAGEMSGHFFFTENWFGFDDAIYASAKLLDILSSDKRSSNEIFAQLPDSVNTPEIRLPMAEDQKTPFMKRLLSHAVFENGEKITIDGLRVDFGYGWGLVRASNTTPFLILRFEADNEANLVHIKNIFRQQLLMIDPNLQLSF